MPGQDAVTVQPPPIENEDTAPSSQPIVGIIYPPPEVRSILTQQKKQKIHNNHLQIIILRFKIQLIFFLYNNC